MKSDADRLAQLEEMEEKLSQQIHHILVGNGILIVLRTVVECDAVAGVLLLHILGDLLCRNFDFFLGLRAGRLFFGIRLAVPGGLIGCAVCHLCLF